MKEEEEVAIKKKEDVFYKGFREFGDKVVLVAEAFNDMVQNFENIEEKAANIKTMETECDQECHKILRSLRESFVTPFDREDIFAITREMDDIVDCMEEVANRLMVFDVKAVRPEALEMTDMTLIATRELATMFNHLAELKKNSIVMEQIIEVNRIENECDVVYRKAISNLFREEKDPIEIIKWKHLFEMIEESMDSCENVANMIEGVVAKYA